MDELRKALQEGLREEAAPIGRRLAEVKGLQNNALGRLGRIEATLESERRARVDDLALLVDLLVDGLKATNARLVHIEELLLARAQAEAAPAEPEAEVYRLPTADAG
jgi:hypothetical protein